MATQRRVHRITGALAAAAALVGVTAAAGYAVSPTPQTLYQLPSGASCTKAVNNCVLYPKATALPGGRLIAAFEKSTVAASGSADGQTIPVYKSDDDGSTWQPLSEVKAPAYSSSNPAVAKYVSNWTNPYLYVMPQTVGSLSAGTLLLSTVVSGDDYYYLEQKAADPNWVPSHDGDRKDTAIALYASTDAGATWSFVNIVATGGWSNGYNWPAAANTYRSNDPVWEPYLMVHNNQLVAYYSDENEYTGYNRNTGVATPDPANTTSPDPGTQILAHRTWDGTSPSWSAPVVDVAGLAATSSAGQRLIGGGRPGMTNVVPTTDGKWFMTFEYFGGGDNVRYKVGTDPLKFFAVGGDAGSGVTSLPVTADSGSLSTGGSPVLLRLPSGKILFNSNGGGGSVWTNTTGSSTGAWTMQRTTSPQAYSRNLTYVPRTGRVEIIGGHTTLSYADVDFGSSSGPYYKLVNRNSGKALAVLGGSLADAQNVVQWSDIGSADQRWHLVDAGSGYTTLLNKNSGRALGVWEGSTAEGARAAQWVENLQSDQQWQLVPAGAYYKLVDRKSGKVLAVDGASVADGAPVVQWTDTGSLDQQWSLVQVP